MFAKPDLHRYHVSAGSARWLYLVIFVLLELGVGGHLRQKMSRLSAVWAHRGWTWHGAEPAAAVALQAEGKRFGIDQEQGVGWGGGGSLWAESVEVVACFAFTWWQALLKKKLLGAYVVFAHRQWCSVYSETVSVLGLVLLSPLTITWMFWMLLWVTNVLLHFCNA